MAKLIEFIESSVFMRYVSEYLGDDELRKLQAELANQPEAGDLIPGTGGFRKLRWADSRRGKGRRGGLRVIYYNFSSDHQIWLMTIYDKNEAADLTATEKKILKTAITEELEIRSARRDQRSRRKSNG